MKHVCGKTVTQRMHGHRFVNTCNRSSQLDCKLQLLFIPMVAHLHPSARANGSPCGWKKPKPSPLMPCVSLPLSNVVNTHGTPLERLGRASPSSQGKFGLANEGSLER